MMRDVRTGKLDNKQLYEVEKTVEQMTKLISNDINKRSNSNTFLTSLNVSNFKTTPVRSSPRENAAESMQPIKKKA